MKPRFAAPATAQSALGLAEDADLLRLCAEEEQEALDELVRRYQARLYHFLYRLMGSAEDAEEAVLEVFVRAWRHAPSFRYKASVATWLYRIAANLARDARDYRRVRPVTTRPDAYELAQHAAGNAETTALERIEREGYREALHQALNRLNKNDRLVLVLYYLEECDYTEMQAITGWVYPVLKTRMVRARKRLREQLSALGIEAM